MEREAVDVDQEFRFAIRIRLVTRLRILFWSQTSSCFSGRSSDLCKECLQVLSL